jgi:hypothetical protein
MLRIPYVPYHSGVGEEIPQLDWLLDITFQGAA